MHISRLNAEPREHGMPKRIAVLYSTRDGHTKKIIDTILRQNTGEWTVDIFNLHDEPEVEIEKYEKVLIAASIRYGHFHPSLNRFVNKYLSELQNKDAHLITVNLVARKEGKNTPETNLYTRKWLAQSKWKPTSVEVFAGALMYSKYNWWQTLIIQLIMWMTGGSTDKTKDIEFTNWEKVQNFAEQLLKS